MERKEIIRRTRALDRDEQELVVKMLPIDVVVNRVINELKDYLHMRKDVFNIAETYKEELD